MKTIITFGEIMGRICPENFQRFQQSMPGKLDMTFAGAEANVAASVAMLGGKVKFVTALPDNEMTQACLSLLKGIDVDVSEIKKVDYGRFGLYFVERGANQKCKKDAFEMMLRIPDWAKGSKLIVNGKVADVDIVAGTYAKINRKWKKGDVVSLDMPMDIKMLEGNPLIEEVRNQVALKRGPVVYCVESPDLPEDTKILDVYISAKSNLEAKYKADLLGGVTAIVGDVKLRKDKREGMYQEISKPEWETVQTQFIPYFSWANRGVSEMSVWIPIDWE